MSEGEEEPAGASSVMPAARAGRRANKYITPLSGVIVNTSLCKYSAVRRSADGMGWTECEEGRENWQVFWTDLSVNHMRVRALQPLQRINHFADMNKLCNKAESALTLRAMLKYFHTEYHFFPQSWSLPKEMSNVVARMQPQPGKPSAVLILKPSRGCQGTDVSLVVLDSSPDACNASAWRPPSKCQLSAPRLLFQLSCPPADHLPSLFVIFCRLCS